MGARSTPQAYAAGGERSSEFVRECVAAAWRAFGCLKDQPTSRTASGRRRGLVATLYVLRVLT